MAVYQSTTEPIVRAHSYRELVSGAMLDSIGKRKIIQYMRKINRIPSRAKPKESFYDGHWCFEFRWFEVETNA